MAFVPGMQGWYNISKSIKITHHVNKRKDKIHMIIVIDSGKLFDVVELPFTTKTHSQVGVEGACLNIMKAI